ncbi:MAG: hypothetical protein JG777_2247 [Clostridia bacterium]|jgi:hypothetical protein|nr:hypothetical protein [Clostridia bacterium]
MIYLKTIFSAPNEIKYLKLNLREAFDYIDNFIICEYNRTHTGEERELIFERYINQFSDAELDKIIYLGADISKEALLAKGNSEIAHKNEQLMRGYFASQVNLKGSDIVFSVDADEIIFGQFYEPITDKLGYFNRAIKLPLHQFFYRVNYLWENKDFIAPTVCKVKYYGKKYPAQWRYDGKLYPEKVGCHFSWLLTTEEMINKLNVYSHNPEYGHLARKDVCEEAVRTKTYPFDSSVDFKIRVLDVYKDTQYYPRKIYDMLDDFQYMMG